MRRTGAALLLAMLLAAAPVPAQRTILIEVHGEAPRELQRGVEFGVAEAARTAALLGADVRLAEPDVPGRVDGVIVTTLRGTPGPPGVPAIHVVALPPQAGRCDFSVAVPADAGAPGTLVRWHQSLARYGASELNERFARQYGAGMTDAAWAGWAAVKALVESALRNPDADDRCASLAALRFDGHKGRPLQFHPHTRVLSQPLYILEGDRIVGERK